MANVVMLTKGTGGDLHPFIRISNELRQRGHSLLFATNDQFGEEVRRYGLEFAPLDPPERVEQMRFMQTREGMAELLSKAGTVDPLVFASCMDVYNIVSRSCDPGRTVVVSHHDLTLVTQMIAERLQLPYLPVFTAPYFLAKQLNMLEHFYQADTKTLNCYRAKLALPPIHDWGAWLRQPRWQMGLWPAWYAAGDDKDAAVNKVNAVGFIANPVFETGALPSDVDEFLCGGAAPVLITHGTSRPYRPEFFTASTEACAMLGLRALVVTRHAELVPESLPSGIMRCDYLPFASVLGRVDAVVHHGGIGTLHQSLAAAVPQLIMGYGFDRPDNGQRAQRLGVGAYLPSVRWRAETVATVLRGLQTKEVRARCASLAHRLRKSPDATATACDLIELVLAGTTPAHVPANASGDYGYQAEEMPNWAMIKGQRPETRTLVEGDPPK